MVVWNWETKNIRSIYSFGEISHLVSITSWNIPYLWYLYIKLKVNHGIFSVNSHINWLAGFPPSNRIFHPLPAQITCKFLKLGDQVAAKFAHPKDHSLDPGMEGFIERRNFFKTYLGQKHTLLNWSAPQCTSASNISFLFPPSRLHLGEMDTLIFVHPWVMRCIEFRYKPEIWLLTTESN